MYFLLFLSILLASSFACKYDECKNVDLGSCGNACCKLEATIKMNTVEAMNMLNSSINAGGPDKQYAAQPLADGGIGFGDLRQYNIDADFIGQAFHTTDNKEYVDTVNMVLYPISKGSARIKAFSISQVGGAYGDDGQNYYNIWNLFTNVFGADTKLSHVDMSCPSPKAK